MNQQDIYFAVCDDIPAIRENVGSKIKKIYGNKVDLHLFSNGEELKAYVTEAGSRIGIIFLDIQLGEENGIQEAIQIQKINPEDKVIFMTGYTKYLSDIFEARPNDLLFKPIEDDKLERVLQRTFQSMEEEQREAITLKLIGGSKEQIKPVSIAYVESEKRIIHVHTDNTTMDLYFKLEDLMKELPNYFVYCHKSYIINMKRIKNFSTEKIILDNGISVPVSRSRREQVRNAFFEFSRQRFHTESGEREENNE